MSRLKICMLFRVGIIEIGETMEQNGARELLEETRPDD
jgi:NADH pyrophosphatase NudC (nudix superfamily)